MPAMSTLEDLFVKELRDVYDAERQITKALPKMIKASESDDLTEALRQHLDVTKTQIERLDQVFQRLDMRPRGNHCPGMAGIIEEGAHLLEEGGDESVLEAGLIGSAQKVEHYEIAAYGTLCAFARQLGHEDAVALLEQTLAEEKETDQRLTQIAEAHVNRSAQAEAGDATMGDEARPTARRGRRTGNGGAQSTRKSGTRQASASRGSASPRKARAPRAGTSSRRSSASDRAARRR